MDLHLYDTYSKSKKQFNPIDHSNVRMYVCGPTVYDYAHVGNARPVIIFDILFRLLRKIYGNKHVTYVRNITDVDDKIIEAAKINDEQIEDLTKRTINYFHNDADYVCSIKPTFEPKATEHISEMIEMIETLIQKGFAYESKNNVLFTSSKFTKYGNLSGKNIDELLAGARIDIEDFKKESSDFVLWKPSKDNEPGWESPWGHGRPGWHIECSAMSKKYLGETFDIHGGGQDLIFPHHENEIAQSECSHEKQFSNFWMHNGFVTIEGSKMSKSDGNFVTINQLKGKYQGEVIRLAMIMTHYRQPLNWMEDTLNEAKKTLDKWYGFLSKCDLTTNDKSEVSMPFFRALLDDMNSPQAITELHQLFKSLNTNDVEGVQQFINSGQILGLLNSDANEWKKWLKSDSVVDEAKINQLMELRNMARKNGDYSSADKIRKELDQMGVTLEDKDGQTSWKLK